MRPNWFVGLPIDPGDWLEAMPAPPASVRVFGPGDLHATVAFLGGVDADAARRAFALADRWPTGPLEVVNRQSISSPGTTNPARTSMSPLT